MSKILDSTVQKEWCNITWRGQKITLELGESRISNYRVGDNCSHLQREPHPASLPISGSFSPSYLFNKTLINQRPGRQMEEARSDSACGAHQPDWYLLIPVMSTCQTTIKDWFTSPHQNLSQDYSISSTIPTCLERFNAQNMTLMSVWEFNKLLPSVLYTLLWCFTMRGNSPGSNNRAQR